MSQIIVISYITLQPVRNKDVIDQLIIRTFDDTLKITEEVIDLENEERDNSKEVDIDIVNMSPSHKIFYPQLSKDVSLLNKDENDVLNIASLFESDNNSNSSTNANTSQHEKSLNESSNDSIVNKMFGSLMNDSEISVTSILNKESVDKSLIDKSKKTSVLSDKASAELIVSSEGTFDSNDEFININLLDNPDFVKKINHTINVTHVPASSTSKMEDSDIEIVDIDDTEIIPIKNIKSESNGKERKSSIDVNEKANVDPEKDMKEQSSTDMKDSNVSCNTNKSSVTKIDKPLTLDDIKDTGFSGAQLYKCGYETCNYSVQTAAQLKIHVKECTLGGDNKNLSCAHCSKRFLRAGFLLEHLKSHGLKRFGCSLCKMRCTVGYQAMAHMKMKHKYAYSKLIPADPKNPSVDGLFIVQPIVSTFTNYFTKLHNDRCQMIYIYKIFRLFFYSGKM